MPVGPALEQRSSPLELHDPSCSDGVVRQLMRATFERWASCRFSTHAHCEHKFESQERESLQSVTERLWGWGAKVGANVRGHPAIVGDIRPG